MLEPCIFIYVGFFPLHILLFGIPFKWFSCSRRKKCSDFIDFFPCDEKCRFGEIVMDFFCAWDFFFVGGVDSSDGSFSVLPVCLRMKISWRGICVADF